MIDPTYELVETQAHSSFRCVHKSCATFATEHPMHFHPAYELTWILRSSGTRYVGDSVERYSPDDLILSGPSLPHCWRDDPDPGGNNAPEWIIVQFDPGCFGADFLTIPEAGAVCDLLDQAQCGLRFEADTVTLVAPLLRGLVGRNGLSRMIGLIEILDILSHQAHRRLAAVDYSRSNVIDRSLVERLERVQHYIASHLSEEISQVEIATLLGMRPPAFSKFFRAATGRTFMSLVKMLRINEACRLLAATDARVTTIALDCGYRHTSHFDEHFQELKGMSPSDYRRRMRGLTPGPTLEISR